mmetsp:Transcript_44614/g.114020  ORF Transcript_44614/g.114020 Transcript_44614/m.114020 type:complete len:235 (+) Transcript_44614:895-1599(+)
MLRCAPLGRRLRHLLLQNRVRRLHHRLPDRVPSRAAASGAGRGGGAGQERARVDGAGEVPHEAGELVGGQAHRQAQVRGGCQHARHDVGAVEVDRGQQPARQRERGHRQGAHKGGEGRAAGGDRHSRPLRLLQARVPGVHVPLDHVHVRRHAAVLEPRVETQHEAKRAGGGRASSPAPRQQLAVAHQQLLGSARHLALRDLAQARHRVEKPVHVARAGRPALGVRCHHPHQRRQ